MPPQQRKEEEEESSEDENSLRQLTGEKIALVFAQKGKRKPPER
jgi:hypothetical protein